ncbi:serine hydrolase [Paenibacillus sp.]|uniref:serine hydrolase domain-containing protein n=1 Tax=Paenibacillus sp. TaxID=58172 RepID=UPI002811BED6|nr:serine hydrolase [Paenibacillus sp.]
MQNTKRLPRSRPEAEGVSPSAVLAFLDAVEREKLELHSFMLLRRGRVVSEGWWAPYGPGEPHILNSLSKSFTATAIGIAAEEGLLSTEDIVASYFPEASDAASLPYVNEMRIRHLLTMSSGHAQDTLETLLRRRSGDWARAFLETPLAYPPGVQFVYNSGATYMLSAILRKATGQSLIEYLTPRLFGPLGIEGVLWETCPDGVEVGGWGMRATTEQIAKFGQLYLQRGMWGGRRLLSEAWVREATADLISNGDDAANDWHQGYGFQFWRCRHGAYRGDGAFGQFCVVLEPFDAVLAITAGTGDMQGILSLVWTRLLPGLQEDAAEDDAAYAALLRRQAELAIPAVAGDADSATARRVSGNVYELEDNGFGLRHAAFRFIDDRAMIALTGGGEPIVLRCGYGEWLESRIERGGFAEPVWARGGWRPDGAFAMTICWTRTPFVDEATCRFEGDRVVWSAVRNVGETIISTSLFFPSLAGTRVLRAPEGAC